jgi:hypothetical protein
MVKRARLTLLTVLLFGPSFRQMAAVDARFDLVGPKIDVRVTRTGTDGVAQTLPIATVPNLQVGDKLWIHPDLPPTQSVKYLLICVFLRGNTNPPPENWFTRIETWNPKVRAEGTFVTVPPEAQQALLFMAPETGGDFSTLRSAVQGRPGAFVRASQDLTEAGFEQARIEKYLASIRRVPPSDPAELQKHSDLLARTLALKPNTACFQRPVDTQFTCLTQTGTQVVLDDGHGQNIVNALSNGPSSDFITQASYTQAFGAGVYSAYVGAIVDLVRIMGNLHTAQYQYIPAISFPQAESMNLRLNTPPSFHNPKSVLVIALPSVQAAVPPPLRPADAHHVACLLEPSVALPIEGAPLVFSADFAHDLVLHLNTPSGAPPEPDIPLIPDAYAGGLVLQRTSAHHIPLHDPELLQPTSLQSEKPNSFARPDAAKQEPASAPAVKPQPEPVTLTGTIRGHWGFDAFTGPTVPLQQLPGKDWSIVAPTDTAGSPASSDLIAGRTAKLLLTSTGTACVHTIIARPTGRSSDLTLSFTADPKLDQPNILAVTLPQDINLRPGDLHLAIQQYDQPKADELSARTFAEPAQITDIELHAGDRSLLIEGDRLSQVSKLSLGDLVFTPSSSPEDTPPNTLQLSLAPIIPNPTTHAGDHLTAKVILQDGRSLNVPVIVAGPRPSVSLIGKSATPVPGSIISLTDPDDIPLSAHLTFTLKSLNSFPRNGEVEVETIDSTLRTVLTLAPSGGLVLQDPRTVVATLDPLRSFGPSAFGALRLRAIFPAKPRSHSSESASEEPTKLTPEEDTASPASDWIPLVTLVRLPTLGQLACPTDSTQPCTLAGSNLFLVQAVSNDPAFDNPIAVPDGYTGSLLNVPHPIASTLFLKLRDDPSAIDSANLPLPPPPSAVSHVHTRKATAVPSTSVTTPSVPPTTILSTPAPSSSTAPTSPASPPTIPHEK